MKLRDAIIAAPLWLLPQVLLAEVTPGEILVAELNCVACHAAAPAILERLASREAPHLAADGLRIKPQWLREFLTDPQKAKPGTLMPDTLQGIPEEKKPDIIEALTHFLVSVQPPLKAAGSLAPSDALIEAGRKLYHEVGCVQCHAPERLPKAREADESAAEELTALQQISVPIGDLRNKLTLGSLAYFLRDPLKSHPSGRMPSLRLTGEEADAVAAYLLRERAPGQGAVPPDDLAFTVDSEKAQAGAGYFVGLRCAECHRDAAAGLPADAKPSPARRLESLRSRQPAGCISTRPKPGIPKFELTDRQRTVIIAALQNQAIFDLPLTPDQQIKRAMTVLNCYACHARDRRGGPEGLRRDYLASNGAAEFGEEGRVPPPLTRAGEKFPVAWLRESIVNGAALRPYMATRMPLFGEANVLHLPEIFQAADARDDAQPQPDVSTAAAAADADQVGRELIGGAGLNCIACHTLAGQKSPGIPGLDLATSARRLRWDWFRRYLLDPQSLRSGTRMPSFWVAGSGAERKPPPGDPEKQVAAIWAYLARGDFSRLPKGLGSAEK